MEIKVGDLVRVRGTDWLQKPLGIITEIKQLIHVPSGTEYTVVTALIGEEYFTFGGDSFELVSEGNERKKLNFPLTRAPSSATLRE